MTIYLPKKRKEKRIWQLVNILSGFQDRNIVTKKDFEVPLSSRAKLGWREQILDIYGSRIL